MTAMRDAIARFTADSPGLADPADGAALLALLRRLHDVGRRDLPLGRLIEGHVDALQIVHRFGTPAQADAAARAARGGAAFGVWNADLPDDPLRLECGRLNGGKAFASGAGVIGHALVSVDVAGGRQLILLDLRRTPPRIDRDWWRTTGMARSDTHLVRWVAAAVADGDLIGAPGDYVREPWFGGGALRFAAVQAGGVSGLVDRTRDHLVTAGRAADPHQAARLTDLFLCAAAANAAVREAGERWFTDRPDAMHARVAAARVQVAAMADQALAIAQQAVGVQGLFLAHPLAALVADLGVYLRQPAPDAQRMRLAAAVAGGVVAPAL